MEEQGSSPHEAIFFVLTYLPLFELLSIARVCRSLRDAVKNDTLPWLKIVVDRPLHRRISDHRLMQVASMARGRLQALALVNCFTVTDDGLLTVIGHNPLITKLHLPGCTSLSPQGIVRAVQLLTKNNHRLRSLEISGVYGVRKQDLEMLRSLIIPDENTTRKKRRGKILYHEHSRSSTTQEEIAAGDGDGDDPRVDVDMCPKCNEVRMVFDCPQHAESENCRGCMSCIERCAECGVCMKGVGEAEAASCADALCLECWLKLPKCSFCNKPYCSLHAHLQHTLSHTTAGFLCDACHSKSQIENTEEDQILNH